MKTLICFCFLFSCLQISYAQIYTIPWAQQQPAWVFPLWFENGDGQKDTLYYCYDINSGDPFNPDYDTIFGDFAQIIDTTKFQVYYGCSLSSDFLASKSTTTNYNLEGGIDICFYKAILPITLRWDPNLFYSDSLPFPDLDPAPLAQGKLLFDIPMGAIDCSYQYPIYMTDSIIEPYAYSPACVFADSIQFTGFGVSYLIFNVEPWIGQFLAVQNIVNQPVTVEQNDLSGEVLIANSAAHSYQISIYNILGEPLIQNVVLSAHEEKQINLSNAYHGMYILTISSENQFLSFKLIKP